MKLHFAPVQGHTDAPFRHFHSALYGGDNVYYTPFIRLEHGALRQRDLRDYTSPLNAPAHTVAQIIFHDEDELRKLVALMKAEGAGEINLNMGCPFPLQTGHGRGAATVGNAALAKTVADVVKENPDVRFSVKMRLGFSDPDEWKVLLPELNSVSLVEIAVHPRVARQQYSGDLYLDRFGDILRESENPVVFNGELKTPSDIMDVTQKFPGIAGVMVGRGALARPSIFSEFEEGSEYSRAMRIEKMLGFHNALLDYYSSTLCGESQLLSKIKPFWEYAEDEIGRKPWKAIKKASNIAKYHSAVASI